MDKQRLQDIRDASERQFAFEDGKPPKGYTAMMFYDDHSLVLAGVDGLTDALSTCSRIKRKTDGAARAAILAYLDDYIAAWDDDK